MRKQNNKVQCYNIISYVDEIYPNLKDEEKSKLVDELYKEKSEVSSVAKSKTAVDRNNSEIDVAYENVMAEENYIVGLINGLGENTNLDNWEFNLEYLKNNIDSIKNISDVNLAYVESYMEAYEWVKLNENMPDQKVNENAFNFTTAAEVMATSYSYSDAVSYANKYYKNYNSNYPDWNSAGGDCANFISQCLYAGGKSMKGTPGTKKAADDFANWFSKGSSQNVKNVSSTWRVHYYMPYGTVYDRTQFPVFLNFQLHIGKFYQFLTFYVIILVVTKIV